MTIEFANQMNDYTQEQFYKNKSLGFGKKFRNKLRTDKKKVSRLAISKIINKDRTSEKSLAITYIYCM